jgi:hypothetical protein
MAIAELTQEAFAASESAAEGAGRVRVGVHDASRLEWSLSVPLPEPKDGPARYSLKVEMQIPQNAFARHVPWDQMQAFTRLDGPAYAAMGDVVTIDALRRGALAMANQLARASDGFQRHCRLAASLFATAAHSELEDALTIWIEAAVRIAEEARQRLCVGEPQEATELVRERALVDEYVSIRLLEMLAGAERAIDTILESKSAHAKKLEPVLAVVEERLGAALAGELTYRTRKGFPVADRKSPNALERYLDRSSRLKKHFQEVLFLEQESFKTAERTYHWAAAVAALVASTWAFAWQMTLVKRAQSAASAMSSGFMLLVVVAGIVYASKDRLKEIGRNWMIRRVHKLWKAERITRYRAPQRRLPNRNVIVMAKETFSQKNKQVADPLNPECGASTGMTVLSYTHHGEVTPSSELLASGVRRVKHVFRYDLSPLFARLDDATKPVPVLDEANHVRFIDAPRCYRVPIKVVVVAGGSTHIEETTLVMHKRGLERLDRNNDGEEDSTPRLLEVGIEPG